MEFLAEARYGCEADEEDKDEEGVAGNDVGPVVCCHRSISEAASALLRIDEYEDHVPRQRRDCTADVYAAIVVKIRDDFPEAKRKS